VAGLALAATLALDGKPGPPGDDLNGREPPGRIVLVLATLFPIAMLMKNFSAPVSAVCLLLLFAIIVRHRAAFVRPGPPRDHPVTVTFSSIRSQIDFSMYTPSNRAISCNPVGDVTLISVR
jgi:hypothetical protein